MSSPRDSSPRPESGGGRSVLLIGGAIVAGVAVLTYLAKPAGAATLTPAQQALLRSQPLVPTSGAISFRTPGGTAVSLPLDKILNSIFPSRAAATPTATVAVPPVASAQRTLITSSPDTLTDPQNRILQPDGTLDTPTDSAASGQAAYDGLPIASDVLRERLALPDSLAIAQAQMVAEQDAGGQIPDVGALLPTDFTEFSF